MDYIVRGVAKSQIRLNDFHFLSKGSKGFPGSSAGKEAAYTAGDPGSILGLGSSTGEGIGYLLRYSWVSLVAQIVKNLPASGRPGFDPWVGRIP